MGQGTHLNMNMPSSPDSLNTSNQVDNNLNFYGKQQSCNEQTKKAARAKETQAYSWIASSCPSQPQITPLLPPQTLSSATTNATTNNGGSVKNVKQ